VQIALIIEGVFFYSLSLPPVCAYLLWSLSPRTTALAYNRGPGAAFFASGKKMPNTKLALSIACPELVE